VTVQDLTPELAEFFGTKDGVLVASVNKDTPAAKAGLKAGDVLTAIDGKSVGSSSELIDQLREKSGEITVSVVRDKKALSLKATLDKPDEIKPRTIRRGVGA
jgi:S1-C subfamily serine protease